jgi:hypothetical protein
MTPGRTKRRRSIRRLPRKPPLENRRIRQFHRTGTGGQIDTTNSSEPVIGFVFSQQGLMADVTIEGSKTPSSIYEPRPRSSSAAPNVAA